MSETTKKWNEQVVAQLLEIVGTESPVTAATVEAAAAALDISVRSVAAKLRQLDLAVESLAKVKVSAFSDEETAALSAFVASNAGTLTYKDIAEQFANGKFNAKQIQGKVLALELTGSVKAAEKVEVARSYTQAEEDEFIALVNKGAFIEEIAAALNKTVSSVRGKALSLTRKNLINGIPAQKESHAKEVFDVVEALGDKIAKMTVAEIAREGIKTERGIKTLLTRRGIDCADYKGSEKKAKAEAKASA